MGLTFLEIAVGNPSLPSKTERVKFLIDSGAIYSVVPSELLKQLNIKPLSKEEFYLANGDKIIREKGGAIFKYKDRIGVSDVIFGQAGDSNLLGVTTLESLGLSLDPLRRTLNPLPMILG